MNWIMHINYCEQGQSIEDTCRKAKQWGYHGIEFRGRPGNLCLDEYLDRIAAAYSKEGLGCIHFSGGLRFNDPKPEASEAELRRLFHFLGEAKKRFPLGVCNLQTDWMEDKQHPYDHYEKHGSALATGEILQRQILGLQQVADFARENQLLFALETHQAYLHDLPAAARALIDEVNSPFLGVTLDYGNIVGFSDPPSLADCLHILKGRIFHIHWKNSVATGTRYRQRCALSEGEINHREFLQLLLAEGYQGNICLESPRKGDREFFAMADIAYARSLLKDGAEKNQSPPHA